MLIAGTSCVDYSTMNNKQKKIDEKGESGQTFWGMLAWVKRTRPSIVVQENVCSAPWEEMVGYYAKEGYAATFLRVDTKNHYIPHTRTRIYLLALDTHAPNRRAAALGDAPMGEAGGAGESGVVGEEVLARWEAAGHQMSMTRPRHVHDTPRRSSRAGRLPSASCPAPPPPRSRPSCSRPTTRASTPRARTSPTSTRPSSEAWSTGAAARRATNARAPTRSSAPSAPSRSGCRRATAPAPTLRGTTGAFGRRVLPGETSCLFTAPPPGVNRFKSQVERVVDLCDINYLRLAREGQDANYKTLVWNLSQNVDRSTASSRPGVCPCLTPNMVPYVTNRGGPIVGPEVLALQGSPADGLPPACRGRVHHASGACAGIPVDDLLLTRENNDQMADLAGNAMSSTIVGTCILAALLLSRDTLRAFDAPKPDAAAAGAGGLVTSTGSSETQVTLPRHFLDTS